jgi:hypothetical protein
MVFAIFFPLPVYGELRKASSRPAGEAPRTAVQKYGEHGNEARRSNAPLYATFLAFSKASSIVPTM